MLPMGLLKPQPHSQPCTGGGATKARAHWLVVHIFSIQN